MNGATHYLDLSQLYGTSTEKFTSLQAPGGMMKTFNDFGRELPPLSDKEGCLIQDEGAVCFDSGRYLFSDPFHFNSNEKYSNYKVYRIFCVKFIKTICTILGSSSRLFLMSRERISHFMSIYFFYILSSVSRLKNLSKEISYHRL